MLPVLTLSLCLLVFSNTAADSARKFDEYAGLSFSEEKARLDNLAIQLRLEPNSVAWYFIFAGTSSCEGEARLRAARAKNYIVKKHGIQADRIIWVDEGYRESPLVEIWLWPRSMGKPYPTNVSLDGGGVQFNRNCKQTRHSRQRRIKIRGAHKLIQPEDE